MWWMENGVARWLVGYVEMVKSGADCKVEMEMDVDDGLWSEGDGDR